jgi:hypothetical protein
VYGYQRPEAEDTPVRESRGRQGRVVELYSIRRIASDFPKRKPTKDPKYYRHRLNSRDTARIVSAGLLSNLTP